MAKLTSRKRKHLKSSQFALPGRRYPVEDKTHARAALSRVSQHGSPEEKATVRRKVHGKYPGIAVGGIRKAAKKKHHHKTAPRKTI